MADAVKRVLLIEDNDVDAAVFTRYVHAMPGWVVTRVQSLEEAEEQVEQVGSSFYDLVAVDLTLPDAFDLEAVHFARDQLPQAVCVAVTARDPKEVDQRALKAGAADLLVKGQMNARGVQRAVTHAVDRNQLVRRQLESERNLRSVLAAWSDALFVVGDEQRVLFRNDAAATLADAVTDDHGDRLRLSLQPGDVLQTDVARPGGSPIPVEARAWPINWADGPATVVVLRDRRAERAAERARTRIEEMERSARLGAGALAGVHDIGNRVQAMAGQLAEVEQLLAAIPAGARGELSEALGRVRESCDHIGAIVRSSRSEAAEVRHVRQPLDVGAVVRSCCQAMRHRIEPVAGLRLQIEPAAEVLGDAVALRRVVDNLLSNAVEAIGPGHADRHEIRVSVQRSGEQVVVEVEDTGPGMSEAVQEHIFDRHWTTKDEGTGIGLASCRDVVEAHDGEIGVRSAPDAGACFSVSLPAMRARTSSIRLLLVEDRPEVARANQRLLGQRYDVVVALDGGAGLARLEREDDVAVILCDLDMPGMDGRGFFERLRSDHPDLTQRVAFCSGGATSAELDAWVRASGRPLLAKPFDLGEAIPLIEGLAAGTAGAHGAG